MNKHDQFQLCLDRAKQIVAAYRAEAPEGCDPQNTWVTIGVGVAGVAVSAGSAALQSSQAKKAASKQSSSIKGGIPQIDFPKMPPYVPVDYDKLQYGWEGAINEDRRAYARSDADFLKRHPQIAAAEGQFASNVQQDQTGDHTFIPQMQQEAIKSGLGSSLAAFGDSGPVLARGSGAEADVAKNLGLSVASFQDRNRQNAQSSLSLAEQIFPRRQIGLNGQDASQVFIGNNAAQNAWNQADYANTVGQLEYNNNITAANLNTQTQTANANAAAAGQASAAQANLYGGIAQSALSTVGKVYGSYRAAPTTTGVTQTYGGIAGGV